MSPDEKTLSIVLAEYNAMRSEICVFHSVEGQLIGTSVAFLAIITALAAGSDPGGSNLEKLIYVVPAYFLSLGAVFIYTQIRIIQAAAYTERQLKPIIDKILDDSGAPRGETEKEERKEMGWEQFRRNKACPLSKIPEVLNLSRWLFFFAPSVITTIYISKYKPKIDDYFLDFFVNVNPVCCFLIAAFAIWSSFFMPGSVMRK